MIAALPDKARTAGEAAKLLGISERCLAGYFARGCPSRGPDDLYDLDAIQAWKAENIRSGPGRPGEHVTSSDLHEALKRAELEKLTEQARSARLKNDILEGQLWHADDVQQRVGELCARIKQRLEAWPGEVEMQLPPETRQQIKGELEHAIRLLLLEMSQWTFEPGD